MEALSPMFRYRAALESLQGWADRLPNVPTSLARIQRVAINHDVSADILEKLYRGSTEPQPIFREHGVDCLCDSDAACWHDELAGTPAGDGIVCGPAGDVTFDGVDAVQLSDGNVITVVDPYGERFFFTVHGASNPQLVREWLADTIGKWVEAADRYHVLVERS